MRIERMLTIVIILLNRRKITAKELASRFEVSLRTIYRDIEAINIAGIPVLSNQGVDGGYELIDNFKLNRHHFSANDMKFILSALKGVNTAINDLELSIVLEKIENLIPENTKDEMIKNDYIIFDVGGWDNSSKQSTKMQEIYEVIKKNQLIEIEYSDSKGIISIRVIEPMTLVLKGFAWYLFAFCREKNDFRMFKILRIKKLIILELFFERKEKEYKEINCHWNPRNMQEITLKFDAKMKFAVKEYFKRGKITKNDDGFIIVLINAPIDNWLIGLILSYGQFVEVLKPSSLREEIKNRISKTMEIYKK